MNSIFYWRLLPCSLWRKEHHTHLNLNHSLQFEWLRFYLKHSYTIHLWCTLEAPTQSLFLFFWVSWAADGGRHGCLHLVAHHPPSAAVATEATATTDDGPHWISCHQARQPRIPQIMSAFSSSSTSRPSSSPSMLGTPAWLVPMMLKVGCKDKIRDPFKAATTWTEWLWHQPVASHLQSSSSTQASPLLSSSSEFASKEGELGAGWC